MKPTARGAGLVLVIAAAMGLGWAHGARSLDAIVVPLLVVGAAALVAVARVDEPTVERRPIRPGSVGDVRRVELAVSTGGATPATVRDEIGDGLAPTDESAPGATTGLEGIRGHGGDVAELAVERETTIGPGATVGYDVRLAERGEHRIGPAGVTVRDPFGLLERRFTDERRTAVVVYPRVHELRGRARRELDTLADAARRHERGEFDHLREYRRGDPLRDVDWKATAKRPEDEPVVAAYTADEALDRVTIVAEAAPGCADDLATAAASVAVHLLELGVGVTLRLPDETVDTDPGRGGRSRLLGALARTGPGAVADPPADAAVEIRADHDGTEVALGEVEVPFEQLRGSPAGRSGGRHERTAGRDGGDVHGPGRGVAP